MIRSNVDHKVLSAWLAEPTDITAFKYKNKRTSLLEEIASNLTCFGLQKTSIVVQTPRIRAVFYSDGKNYDTFVDIIVLKNYKRYSFTMWSSLATDIILEIIEKEDKKRE